MESIIMRALAKDPAHRFQTGAALAQALTGLSHHTGTRSILPTPAKPAGSPRRQSRWLWLIPGLLVIVLAVWQINSREPAVPAVVIIDSPAPTLTQGVRASFSPTPTPSQPPTATPSPTPTASSTPTLTPTPSPTLLPVTPTPVVAPPLLFTATATLQPSPTPCPQSAASEFATLLAAGALREQLGCPRGEATTTGAAWQPFERGAMLWRADVTLIYILERDNRWRFVADRWRDGDTTFDPNLAAPAGLHQPVRGFGLVWREQSGVSELLGWATVEEQGFEALIQEFSGGLIWQDPERHRLFIFFNNGIYQVEEE
jgi:hypothetical protein